MDRAQDEQAVGAAYDDIADTFADTFRATEPEQPVELAMVEHFASLLSGERRVLDAGCGAGRMFPVLRELGCTVEGVDLSAGMIRRARADHPEFPSQVGTLTDLPCAESTFDGVFSWYSTIHSADVDLARIAREIRRVLRPGGVALVAFQSGSGTRGLSESYRKHGHDITLHRYLRTPDQVSEVLAGAGLQEVARLERGPMGRERDNQAVLIARTA